MAKTTKAAALIPARAGSKRVKAKNIREMGGHPLIAFTIAAARASGVFETLLVSTDSELVAEIARHYGAEVMMRPPEFAADLSPDIEWLDYTLKKLAEAGRRPEAFSLLRPTSPFRQAATITRAWEQFRSVPDADSLRAVELCKQHPGKMWVIDGALMKPLLKDGPKNPPWHSSPYQALPKVYAQNASLEIAWTRVVEKTHTIAGEKILPFVTQGAEGFDINDPKDWVVAEHMIAAGEASLPRVEQPAYKLQTEAR